MNAWTPVSLVTRVMIQWLFSWAPPALCKPESKGYYPSVETRPQFFCIFTLSVFFLKKKKKKHLSWSSHFNTAEVKGLWFTCHCRHVRLNYSRWHGFYTVRKLRDSFSCKYFRQLNIYTDNFESWNKFIYSMKNMACYWSWRKTCFIYFCLWTSSSYYLKYVCAEGGRNTYSFVCQNQGIEHNIIKLFKTFVRSRYVLSAGKAKTKMKNYSCLNFFYGILSLRSSKASS